MAQREVRTRPSSVEAYKGEPHVLTHTIALSLGRYSLLAGFMEPGETIETGNVSTSIDLPELTASGCSRLA